MVKTGMEKREWKNGSGNDERRRMNDEEEGKGPE